MAKTRLISPGSIPNHRLLKNLRLDDKYISNDGGDEGIRITDAGLVGIGVADPDTQLEIFGTSTQLKISYDANEYAELSTDDAGTLLIKTTSASTYDDIILDCGRYIYMKKNGANMGHFSYLGSTLALASTSDIEFKTTGTDKDITINPKRHVIIESNGGTFTPSADGHVATKKYVDDEISGAGGGSARSVAGDTDNALISWVTSDNTFAAEANLTFDGTDLLVASTGKLAVGDTATYLHQASDSNLALVADGDITLDANDDIEINANGGTVTIKDDTASHFLFDCDSTRLRIYDDTDAADFFDITVGASGATTIATTDDGAAVGHLTIAADGHVEFDGCGVGFDRISYNDAADVTIDFRTGNKAHLDMTGGSISGTLTLQFPSTSGNFLLVIEQDGSTRTVNAWATKDSAGNAGNNDGGTGGAIRWAGGSAPDLTDGGSKRDIISFYWDADEEVCYGVASLNF